MSAKTIRAFLATSLTVIGCFLWCGCDQDGEGTDLAISPASRALNVGESQTFHASKPYGCNWTLVPDNGSGKLDKRTGDTVVFTLLSAKSGTIAVICNAFTDESMMGDAKTVTAYVYSN